MTLGWVSWILLTPLSPWGKTGVELENHRGPPWCLHSMPKVLGLWAQYHQGKVTQSHMKAKQRRDNSKGNAAPSFLLWELGQVSRSAFVQEAGNTAASPFLTRMIAAWLLPVNSPSLCLQSCPRAGSLSRNLSRLCPSRWYTGQLEATGPALSTSSLLEAYPNVPAMTLLGACGARVCGFPAGQTPAGPRDPPRLSDHP